jgi:hypothetical protein
VVEWPWANVSSLLVSLEILLSGMVMNGRRAGVKTRQYWAVLEIQVSNLLRRRRTPIRVNIRKNGEVGSDSLFEVFRREVLVV